MLSLLSPLSSLSNIAKASPFPPLSPSGRNTSSPLRFLVLRNYPSYILHLRLKPLSSNYRCAKVLLLGLGIKAIRPCKNYAYTGRSYRISKGLAKCINCVRTRESYNLAPINLNKWRRLKKERKRLRAMLVKARAKARRLKDKVGEA